MVDHTLLLTCGRMRRFFSSRLKIFPNSTPNPIMQSSRLTLLIIEFNYHAEVLQAICPLLSERFNLILFTTDKIWNKTGLDKSGFLAVRTREKRSSLKRFFLENRELLKTADLAYFNTLERNHNFFAKNTLPLPAIVRSHNVNSNFLPLRSIDFKNLSKAKIFWHLLREVVVERTYWHRRSFFDTPVHIMLPGSASSEYLEEIQFQKHKEKIIPYSLPFSYLGPIKEAARKNPGIVKIAVTGSINPSRKDFNGLFDAVLSSLEKTTKPMELHFLGGPKGAQGKGVIEKFKGITHPNFRFFYSSQYIPAEEIVNRMRDIDFIIAPILIETHHKIYREIYGSSKISGVENDIIQFQKPTLIPGDYRLNSSIKSVCATYKDTADLSLKLVNWINGSAYLEVENKFAELDAYKKETILDQFETICQGLVQTQSQGPRDVDTRQFRETA